MTIATNTQKETLAAAYAAAGDYASLHTADPGSTGTAELTGGTPAYARMPITWNAGSSDGVYTSNPIDWDVPAGTDLTHVGLWTAVTAGTYLDKVAISATYASQGVYRAVLVYTQS